MSLNIKEFKDGLVAYYVDSNFTLEDAAKLADQETLEYIDSEYALHTHRNTENNDRKSSYLHKANGALIWLVLSTVIAGIPYVLNSVISPSEIYKVEIINSKEHNMSNLSETQTPPAQQPTPERQQLPNVAPVKPTPPPGRILHENDDPRPHMNESKRK